MKKKKKIDVSKDECPMTFVKTKIFLESTSSKEDRIIVVKGVQNFVSIKNTLIEQNYKIKTKCIKKNYYEIVVMTES
ncbi:MAG: hypothetical protein CMP25_00450 [Rickettsiales bacterium]|nr:hypothetical protein [Rickettsiales bacterium]|tara:strand:+ start:398 stop:628 length:231 start_codon:yes stop_codon:yes gene_type:complete